MNDPSLTSIIKAMRSDCSTLASVGLERYTELVIKYLPALEGVYGGAGEPVAAGMETPSGADFTVAQVAQRHGRHPSTVRGWCDAELIRGAYKFMGKEWRIPVESLLTFEESQRNLGSRDPRSVLRSVVGDVKPKGGGESVDLGSWRREAS